jgi:ABC-type phosphate transport system permease subunit
MCSHTIRHVVLPNSISGILTGVILRVSRTAGETATAPGWKTEQLLNNFAPTIL